jgi:hypothetical protein
MTRVSTCLSLVRQAKPGRGGCDELKLREETQRVKVPSGKVAHQPEASLAGRRVTGVAKRRQRACGPWDGASKEQRPWGRRRERNGRQHRRVKSEPGQIPLAGPGAATHRGQRPGHVRKGFPRNLGDPAASTWKVEPRSGAQASDAGAAGSRSALVVPRKRGNRPEGPRGGKGSIGSRNRWRER